MCLRDMRRYGEIWGDMGRDGEGWGGMRRYVFSSSRGACWARKRSLAMRMRRSLTLKAASISLSSPGGVTGLRAEYANLRAGRRYCAVCVQSTA